ncbi:MAG: hypothetical protein SFU56_09905 [Capsulimonadales bacterium]|nr:hypothetical protein [Capsulimonadales bacterium]
MASLWSYWKTIETISPRTIEDDALKDFRIALIGDPAHRAAVRDALLTDQATAWEQEDAANYLREYDQSPAAEIASAFLFRIYTAAPGEPLGVRGPNSVPITGSLPEVIEAMLDAKPDMAIALARRLPAFRLPACHRIIRDVSRVNASIAILSALPGVFPPAAPFLPASSVADVFLLGKNQVVLVMRLAAAFGQKPGVKQMKEVVGVVGSAMGWRTLARELVGFVPLGVGMAIKGAIAYAGTVAVGRAALWFYRTGKHLSKKEIQAAYAEGEAEAREEVDKLIQKGENGTVGAVETLEKASETTEERN